MYLLERLKVALAIVVFTSAVAEPVIAGGAVFGVGAEGDSSDGRAYSLFADVSITDNTWLSAAIARNETNNDLFEFKTKFLDVSLDHFFDPIGIRFGGSYWGDDGFLESKDGHAAIYLRGEQGSISVNFERRYFDLTLGGDVLLERRTIDFSANGIGLTGRLKTSKRTSLFLGGMSYDYSRPIAIQPDTDILRFLAISRISLMNSLIDNRVSGGIEVEFGESRVDLRYATWKTAVFQGRVESLGIGLLMPFGDSADVEFRLASDESDEFGRATVFSVFFYLYKE